MNAALKNDRQTTESKSPISERVKNDIKKEVLDLMELHGYQYFGKGFEADSVVYYFRKDDFEFSWRRITKGKYRVNDIGASGKRTLRAWDVLNTAPGFLQALHAAEFA